MSFSSKSDRAPQSTAPVVAQFSGDKLVVGGGVAIFHVASARVVVVYDPTHRLWFLPKGRRDVNEMTQRGAEREGYEESGYRNRLLPLALKHRQPQPRIPPDSRFSSYSTEPVWTQLFPQSLTSQYILFWFVAETLPPSLERELAEQEEQASGSVFGKPYIYPPEYPPALKLRDRIAMEPKGYEPVKHGNTTNDPEEMMYEPRLLSIQEAVEKLNGSVQADVIQRGWEAIQARLATEA